MKKALDILAWIVSIIFHPIGMPVLGCYILTWCITMPYFKDYIDFDYLKRLVIYFYLLSIIFCFLYALFFIRDKNYDSPKHRSMLLLLVIVNYVVGMFQPISSQMFAPYLWGCILAMIIAYIVSQFWKISFHAIGMGGLLGLLFIIWIKKFFLLSEELAWIVPLVVLFSGLVGTARLYLNAHTPAQLYVGYLVGFISIVTTSFLLAPSYLM